MARIRVCGECMEPVVSCVCPPEPDEITVDVEGLEGDEDDAA
jgi:hypothetical protein